MSCNEKTGTENGVGGFADELGELGEAVSDFRLSVHGWSEAALSRSRNVVVTGRRRIWRLTAGWALGCVLVAGSVSSGVYKHHHQQQLVRLAAARVAERQRLAAQEQARQEEEDLLAKVDSDVSREVPTAMEPLAQLMAGDESK
jgi:hypothetical protein